ncbi:MAG TPA: methyltransferase domain-containing protein [Pontibacter sp.]
MKKYVQYGCGLSAPEGWINFDASPTLRLQKLPVVGNLLSAKLNVKFPDSVRYGDITKGLPGISDNSCDGVYCSHVLEHLSLSDFRIALQNTYRILKPGAIFRCVVPDLEVIARSYISRLDSEDKSEASIRFVKDTLLGVEARSKGIKGVATGVFGNSHHLWMWDNASLTEELYKAGFKDVRKCSFNDSEDSSFSKVEDESRFINAVALEAIK